MNYFISYNLLHYVVILISIVIGYLLWDWVIKSPYFYKSALYQKFQLKIILLIPNSDIEKIQVTHNDKTIFQKIIH